MFIMTTVLVIGMGGVSGGMTAMATSPLPYTLKSECVAAGQNFVKAASETMRSASVYPAFICSEGQPASVGPDATTEALSNYEAQRQAASK